MKLDLVEYGRVDLEAWLYIRSDNFLTVRAILAPLETFYMKMFWWDTNFSIRFEVNFWSALRTRK